MLEKLLRRDVEVRQLESLVGQGEAVIAHVEIVLLAVLKSGHSVDELTADVSIGNSVAEFFQDAANVPGKSVAVFSHADVYPMGSDRPSRIGLAMAWLGNTLRG